MLRILFLTFYYSPDLSAGSFRSTALVNQLSQHLVKLDVVTTTPNRYSSFKPKVQSYSQEKNIKIFRIPLPEHKGGMIDQIMAFSSYYRSTLKLVNQNEYDIVIATSSRLFTAFLGARIAKKKNLPLYLDIRDIFLDTISDIFPKFIHPFYYILALVEYYTFIHAKHINLVSKGFAPYFEKRYPMASLSYYTNGIDREFINSSSFYRAPPRGNRIINVLYAGNIGKGQGLDIILPKLAKLLTGQAKFKIIGDGGQRKKLEHALMPLTLKNIEIVKPMARKKIIMEYKKSDILFLHLNNHEAFKKVLPSKLFEYAATGKPIWAGLNGFSANFARSEIQGCEVFRPGDVEHAIEKFNALALKVERRLDFKRKFSRDRIMKAMARDILKVVRRYKS